VERIIIEGGLPLHGTIQAGGAKNAALPILAATLLTPEPCVISNVPDVSDVRFMIKILQHLGANAEHVDKNTIRIEARNIRDEAPYDLVRKMRASVVLLGPLLGRLKSCKVSVPGGCVIGPRPIDLHVEGLNKLGAHFTLEEGNIVSHTTELTGAVVDLKGKFGTTVLGTENVMMAATVARGITTIKHAAQEPEVIDLADFLNRMGAKITGAGTPTIKIEGVESLHGCEHRVICDRIEAGTFMTAAAITGGNVLVKGCDPVHLQALLEKLEKMGLNIHWENSDIRVQADQPLRGIKVVTEPYPGFPTDMQAQLMAVMCVAEKSSTIVEKVFPERFMHASELARMGAKIQMNVDTAHIEGVKHLSGAHVMASDLRASAALVVAGLAAHGQTTIHRVYHIDRGYENIDDKLRSLGARIWREKGE
jgi:UDP-N-acetylglucosamine 1-carboxyvinyltransferase